MKICKNKDCDKTFMGEGNKVFCSSQCSRRHHGALARARYKNRDKKLITFIECPECKTMFSRGAGRVSGCSQKCKDIITAKRKSDYYFRVNGRERVPKNKGDEKVVVEKPDLSQWQGRGTIHYEGYRTL